MHSFGPGKVEPGTLAIPKAGLRPPILGLLGAVLILGGCSARLDDLAELAEPHLPESVDFGEPHGARPVVSRTAPQSTSLTPATDGGLGEENVPAAPPPAPYPERNNPFEFATDVEVDSQNEREEGLVIKLFGFIGEDSPKAILQINGRTRTLAKGESWGTVELLDIQPPEIRLRAQGVVRTWSLLGPQENKD